jgi:cytidine deaminase
LTELHNLYETAVQILDRTVAMGMTPEAIENTSVSALLTDKGNVYTGMNGNRLENGMPKKTCSEYEAITSMMMSGENRIIGIVTVSFKNRMVTVPCDECRALICRINNENISCGIMTDENTAVSLQLLSNQSTEEKNNTITQVSEWDTNGDLWGNDEPEVPVMPSNNNFNQQFPVNQPYYNNNTNPQMMNNNNYYQQNNPQMMNNNGYYNNNPNFNNMNMGMNNNGCYNNPNFNNMNNNGYYNNPNMNMGMNNNGYYNNNPNPNNMNNNGGYYQQNTPQPLQQNQNPYDSVQPVPPSSIYGNSASRYSTQSVSGNIYVHSSINSQNISRNISENTGGETSGSSSIYKQKLKDLLKAESSTEYSAENDEISVAEYNNTDNNEMKKLAKLDAKEAKKLAKEKKKANKKGFFDQFL